MDMSVRCVKLKAGLLIPSSVLTILIETFIDLDLRRILLRACTCLLLLGTRSGTATCALPCR